MTHDLTTRSLCRASSLIFAKAAVGIVAGAFGAHGLQKRKGITAENLHAWQTASNYAVCTCHLVLVHSMRAGFRLRGTGCTAMTMLNILFRYTTD